MSKPTKAQEEIIEAVIARFEGHPEGALFIGTDKTRYQYADAILGIDETTDALVYSREKLIQAFMDYDGMTPEDATQWYEYNTLRSVPYMQGRIAIVGEL